MTKDGRETVVRSLVAGAGDFPARVLSEADQRKGLKTFDPLPSVGPALRELATALERVGAVASGPILLEGDKDAFLRRWQALHESSNPDELLVVHFAGHGDISAAGVLYLATSGADPERLPKTAVNVRQLIDDAADDSGRPVLLLLDVCGAGQAVTLQQLADIASSRAQDRPRKVWIIAACGDREITSGARFTTATAEVLNRLADHELDINPALPHVPVPTFAAAVHRQLARTDPAAGRGQHVVHTPQVLAHDNHQPPFLPNPDHTTDPLTALLTTMNPLLREFALASAPGLDPLHFVTRAAGNPTANAIHFSGRHSQLARIQQWIAQPPGSDRPSMLVVTGGPGSGKSALLGVTACLTHPHLEPVGDLIAGVVDHFDPRQPATVLAVHARQLTLQQITHSLHRQLHDQHPDPDRHPAVETAPSDTSRLVAELAATDDVLLVLDALDEAIDPAAVCDQLLLPLATTHTNQPGCRILLGTRPWWDTLTPMRTHLDHHPGSELDLDPATEEDRRTLADDLDRYLRRLLPRRHSREDIRRIADHLAHHSGTGAFLIANLYADHLRTTPAGTGNPAAPAQPPTAITDVFDLHTRTLAASDPWITPVLAAVGQGHGDGLPLDLIHHLALTHQPPDRTVPQPADTRRALRKAAFYLRTTPGSDQRLLYRYFHQALTDHTRSRTPATTVHHALLATVPTYTEGARNWELADPYLLRHSAAHATAAGNTALDHLLEDPGFLVHAEPDTLTPRLHHATTDRARLHAHIYRTTTAYHAGRQQSETRRGLLALDAAAWQQPHLAQALARTPVDNAPPSPVPRWATDHRGRTTRLHTLAGHTSAVRAVATVIGLGGIPLAVTGSEDGTVIVWDLATGERLHTLTGHTREIRAVATVIGPGGVPLAVTASGDGTVIVWDLATGERLHTLTSHTGEIRAVATVIGPGGVPLAVTSSGDGTVIVWDLVTGEHLHTLTSHTYVIHAVAAVTGPGGVPLAVTSRGDGTVIVWDLATGEHLHTLTSHTYMLHAVAAVTGPGGVPLAVTASGDGTVIVWDLATGERLHTLSSRTGEIRVVATVIGPGGVPLALTAPSDSTTLIVWDLVTGGRLHSLTSHTRENRAVATITGRGGVPLAVTTSNRSTAIVWDLATGGRLHSLTSHTREIRAVATITGRGGVPLAVTASDDGTAIVWDLATDEGQHTLTGHTDWIQAIATTRCDGSTDTMLAVSVGNDSTVIVWDLATGERLHTLTSHTGEIRAVATVIGPGGVPLAVTSSGDGTVIVWDLVTGEHLHTLTRHTYWFRVVAVVIGPGGVPLAVTGSEDGTVVVWDLVTGERLHSLTGHTSAVRAVGTVIGLGGIPLAVTASGDGTVVVWDLVTGERLHSLTGHTSAVRAVGTVT
ncbi:AAA family ATPase, partial [Streptomyces erythrochromogenes]|uniref:AAA family ATPase n=1 Tax=Streptomyces erythrochromogenes TaxID=285574 RepID=UPI00344AAE06